MSKDFSIGKKSKKQEDTKTYEDSFVAGQEPEATKTFRIPVSIAKKLKIHAATTGQTEKEILNRLVSNYMDSVED